MHRAIPAAALLMLLSGCGGRSARLTSTAAQLDPLGGPTWPYAVPVTQEAWNAEAFSYYLDHPVERGAQVTQCLGNRRLKSDMRCATAIAAQREAQSQQLASAQEAKNIDGLGLPDDSAPMPLRPHYR